MTVDDPAWRAVGSSPDEGLELLAGRDDPWALWARGVCHMAFGDYDTAFATWESVEWAGGEAAGLAAAAIASGLRQLDEHAAALGYDRVAAGSTGAGRVDGLIGTAADHIGMADAAGARRALDLAQVHLLDWRDRVRFSWVSAEWALLTGAPHEAVRHCDAALAAARAAGSVRHRVKSALFLAVARDTAVPGSGAEGLHRVAAEAAAARLRPLVWPAVLVLGERADSREREASREAVAHIAHHLPPGTGSRWGGYALRDGDIL